MASFGKALIGGFGQSDLARNIMAGQQFAHNAEEMSQRRRALEFQLKKQMEQEKEENKILPWDAALDSIGVDPDPEIRNYLTEQAQGAGILQMHGQLPSVKNKDFVKFRESAKNNQEFLKSVSQISLNKKMGKYNQINEEFQAWQEKNPGVDPKQDAKGQKLLTALELSRKDYTELFDYIASTSEEGIKQRAQQLAGDKSAEAFTLSEGQTRFGPDGQPIASVPKNAEADAGKRREVIQLQVDGKTKQVLLDKDSEKYTIIGDAPARGTPRTGFLNESNLRKEFNSHQSVKSFREVTAKYKNMEQAIEEAGSNPKSMVAVDQALITMYNKMLDPESVVRESEYARTAEDVSLLNRLKGKIDKIQSGGAGLTSDERTALTAMAKRFHGVAALRYQETADFYSEIADRSGIDPELVIQTKSATGKADPKSSLKQKYGLE